MRIPSIPRAQLSFRWIFLTFCHPINGRPLLVCLSATSTINTENALDTQLIYTLSLYNNDTIVSSSQFKKKLIK